jgi:hypothetical protein
LAAATGALLCWLLRNFACRYLTSLPEYGAGPALSVGLN